MRAWSPTDDTNPRDRVRLTFCPEAGVRRLLETAAKEAHRSLSAEVLHRVKQTFANEVSA